MTNSPSDEGSWLCLPAWANGALARGRITATRPHQTTAYRASAHLAPKNEIKLERKQTVSYLSPMWFLYAF